MAKLVRAAGTICTATTRRRFPKRSSDRWPRAGLTQGTRGGCAVGAPRRAEARGSRRTRMGARCASRRTGAPDPCRTASAGQWRAACLKSGTTPSSGVRRRRRGPRIRGRVTSRWGASDLGLAALPRRRRRCRAPCWIKSWSPPHTLSWSGSRRGRWIPYWRRWSPGGGCRATVLCFPGQSWGWAAMWHPHSCSCVNCTAGPTSSTRPSSNRSVSVRVLGHWRVRQFAATPITTAGSVGQVRASANTHTHTHTQSACSTQLHAGFIVQQQPTVRPLWCSAQVSSFSLCSFHLGHISCKMLMFLKCKIESYRSTFTLGPFVELAFQIFPTYYTRDITKRTAKIILILQ